MNITTPEEMEGTDKLLEEAILKFENDFKREKKGSNYYHLLIIGEYNRKVCDKVQEYYTLAGWKNVVCKTSSENGERGGLTGLQLSI